MNRLSAVAALAVIFAATGARAAEHCFNMNNVVNSRAADESTVYLLVGVSDVYRIDMQNPCPNLQGGELIVRSVSGSGQICHAIDVDLKVADEGVRAACVVRAITKLTPAEAKTLPKKVRP